MPIVVLPPNLGPVTEAGSGSAYDVADAPGLTLVGGNGESLALAEASGFTTLGGWDGFDLPPYELSSTTPGGWDGGLVNDVRAGIREVYVPLQVHAETTEGLRAIKRQLAAVLNPRNGDTTLIVSHRNGDTRKISGRYTGGFDGALSDGQGTWWQNLGITLLCHEPFWQGPQIIASRFSAGTAPTFFGSPFFPLAIGAGQAIGSVTISNVGDETAYPVWTVAGPGEDLAVTSGDRSWGIDGAIADGETLTIDTRRGVQTVTDAVGDSHWDRVTPNSDLWALQPGENPVTVAMAATDSGSYIEVAYTPRYLTAF